MSRSVFKTFKSVLPSLIVHSAVDTKGAEPRLAELTSHMLGMLDRAAERQGRLVRTVRPIMLDRAAGDFRLIDPDCQFSLIIVPHDFFDAGYVDPDRRRIDCRRDK